MIWFMDCLLEMRFLELTNRGHPNCLRAEWATFPLQRLTKVKMVVSLTTIMAKVL